MDLATELSLSPPLPPFGLRPWRSVCTSPSFSRILVFLPFLFLFLRWSRLALCNRFSLLPPGPFSPFIRRWKSVLSVGFSARWVGCGCGCRKNPFLIGALGAIWWWLWIDHCFWWRLVYFLPFSAMEFFLWNGFGFSLVLPWIRLLERSFFCKIVYMYGGGLWNGSDSCFRLFISLCFRVLQVPLWI